VLYLGRENCPQIIAQTREYVADLESIATESNNQLQLAVQSIDQGDRDRALEHFHAYSSSDDSYYTKRSEINELTKSECILQNNEVKQYINETYETINRSFFSQLENLELFKSKLSMLYISI